VKRALDGCQRREPLEESHACFFYARETGERSNAQDAAKSSNTA
jgi:hypothetical protein